ncbi:MAG TPA: hypothetical protein VGJ21_16270 [Terracidiphilus sp.]
MRIPQNDGGWIGPDRIHRMVDGRYPASVTGRHESPGSVPNIRDRVYIEGYDELFFVVGVDVRRQVVDLVCGERVGFLIDIPFSAIRPAAERRIAS